MDIQQARRRIRNTFENSFDKVKFIVFIKDLLNQYDESKAFHLRGRYIPKAFENIIKSYERIGTYIDPEDKKIDILIVYLQKETTLWSEPLRLDTLSLNTPCIPESHSLPVASHIPLEAGSPKRNATSSYYTHLQ